MGPWSLDAQIESRPGPGRPSKCPRWGRGWGCPTRVPHLEASPGPGAGSSPPQVQGQGQGDNERGSPSPAGPHSGPLAKEGWTGGALIESYCLLLCTRLSSSPLGSLCLGAPGPHVTHTPARGFRILGVPTLLAKPPLSFLYPLLTRPCLTLPGLQASKADSLPLRRGQRSPVLDFPRPSGTTAWARGQGQRPRQTVLPCPRCPSCPLTLGSLVPNRATHTVLNGGGSGEGCELEVRTFLKGVRGYVAGGVFSLEMALVSMQQTNEG